MRFSWTRSNRYPVICEDTFQEFHRRLWGEASGPVPAYASNVVFEILSHSTVWDGVHLDQRRKATGIIMFVWFAGDCWIVIAFSWNTRVVG